MGLSTRRTTRVVFALGAALLAAAAFDSAMLWRDAGRNALIAEGQVPADSQVPELRRRPAAPPKPRSTATGRCRTTRGWGQQRATTVPTCCCARRSSCGPVTSRDRPCR
jgi:hypothetical protein